MEELIFLEETSRTPRGQMFTNGPGNYKIPCFSDVPIELNVSLLKGSPNKRAIYSSRVSYIDNFKVCIRTCIYIAMYVTIWHCMFKLYDKSQYT